MRYLTALKHLGGVIQSVNSGGHATGSICSSTREHRGGQNMTRRRGLHRRGPSSGTTEASQKDPIQRIRRNGGIAARGVHMGRR